MPAMTEAPTALEARQEGTAWEFNPPTEVLESRIFAAGGYLILSGLFNEETLTGLLAEAQASRGEAVRQVLAESDGAEGRGGSPARSYTSGRGGDLHWGLHGSPGMAAALGRVCGARVAPTGSGNYSFYEQPGDFLALHRDILQCDIAVITALTRASTDGRTGELMVYPEFLRDPLSMVRAAGRRYGRPVALERGHTAVLLGGLVPHEVVPTVAGQQRIVAINCFRIETGDAGEPEAQTTPE